jgi:hypothetical protein
MTRRISDESDYPEAVNALQEFLQGVLKEFAAIAD